MRSHYSPYRTNDLARVETGGKNSQRQGSNAHRKYHIPGNAAQEKQNNIYLSADRHMYQNTNSISTERKGKYGEPSKAIHQNNGYRIPPKPVSKDFVARHHVEQALNSKEKKRTDLNDLHKLLNEVTQRYVSSQGRERSKTPKVITQGGLRGQQDYQLMKKRRDYTNILRQSMTLSGQKDRSKQLQPNKSTASILGLSHKRTDSKPNKPEQPQREHISNDTSVLYKFCEISTGKMRQKPRQKSVKKSHFFSKAQQFSLSTNLTFEGKPVELSDFIIISQIESGRTGKVYRCIHKPTMTIYALKIMSKVLIKSLDKQRFIEQIKIQMFVKHPNIVTLYGFFSDEQNTYLIMQYCEGVNLLDYVKAPQLPSQKAVAQWMKDILKALTYLHDLKIVHRDIKPQNILLSCGIAKLCDFGCSALCIQRRSTNIGTFDYLAPQILKHQQYDQNVDMWGLGVLAYQLLTGKAPFYHRSKEVTVQKILKDQLVFPESMSKEAQSFVNMLLIRSPKQRCSARVMQHHSFISINCNQFSVF